MPQRGQRCTSHSPVKHSNGRLRVPYIPKYCAVCFKRTEEEKIARFRGNWVCDRCINSPFPEQHIEDFGGMKSCLGVQMEFPIVRD